MKKPDYSLVLACYNEGPTFEESLNKIYSQVEKMKGVWEIIFVEDKSTDDTRAAVEKFVRENKNAKAIYHNRNLGRGKSVADGIMASRGDICGYIDVDCEIAPTYIPLFVKEIENGRDMVVGKRFYESGLKSITRVVASKVYASIIKLFLDVPIEDTEAGYKFFRRKTILPILKKTRDKHWFWDTEICARTSRAGLAIGEIPVLFIRRPEKKSTVKLIPDSINYISSLIKFRSDSNR
ncbi:MAG: Glycosyl transferase family 2 [Candidatus Gottesmanbacteria bacterium GW2011_GWA1_43_11]|uniref:Glycosyl transferase family 2 n=1 Tax=Candidatus Gottesmanbacteria bacterium GW2011_GWA1_43_11 TaxID=1618436 RepID=A0A0G1CCX6_9BACT|nr:MAG: Glycosyl transferase family 2 [Candidatus Gottesmanbacteria bacterium GW2011_GWA1_43_11]